MGYKKLKLTTIIITMVVLVILMTLLILTTSANAFDVVPMGNEGNTENTSLEIDMVDGVQKKFIVKIDEAGNYVGTIEDEVDKVYSIDENFNIILSYPENEIGNYDFSLDLDFEGDLSIGNIDANLHLPDSSGSFNITGSGRLHLNKPVAFGFNKINLIASNLFVSDTQIKAYGLSLTEKSTMTINNSVGVGAAIIASNFNMNNSEINIDTEFGEGILVSSLYKLKDSVFNMDNGSKININSAGNGLIIGKLDDVIDTNILNSTIKLERKITESSMNNSSLAGFSFNGNINVSDSTITITKFPNGISGTNMNAKNSKITVNTEQPNSSDSFGTAVYITEKINLNASALNITSPLDLGYQNSVQGIWADEINLESKSTIKEDYAGQFYVGAAGEVDIYYNGGSGSQMADIDNYKVNTKNSNLVYNEETKKFSSKAKRTVSTEVEFFRDASKNNEKIKLSGDSSHKVVIPVSLETTPPFVILFETDGGSNVTPQHVVSGQTINKPVEPAKKGYDFDNWYTDEARTQVYDFNSGVTSSLTLYASWREEAPKVHFDADGGSINAEAPSSINKSLDSTTIDISNYDIDGIYEPTKSGYIFMGWEDEEESSKNNNVVIEEKSVTLKAKWISIQELLVFEKPKTVTVYKNNTTEDDVNLRLQTIAQYQDEKGQSIQIPVYYEWNKAILNIGGITEAIPYILDPNTDEKVYGYEEQKVDIYVLNSPYIQTRKNVMLNLGDKVSIDGREWQAIGIYEIPDYSSKRISRQTFKATYDGSEVNTLNAGDYAVKFFGRITDINGETQDLDEVVGASVGEIDRQEAGFWAKSSEEIKKLKKSNYYSTNDLANEKHETVEISEKSDFDRSMIVLPQSNINMLNTFMQSVTKHKNALVRIDMGEYQWDLYSRNFVDDGGLQDKVNVSVLKSNITNQEITQYLNGLNYQFFDFKLDSNWSGEAVFRTKLDFDTNGQVPYMFILNEYTNELELIGVMAKNADEFYSINMRRAAGTYIITNGLPKAVQNIENLENGMSVSPYRISEKTNSFDVGSYEPIKMNIEESKNNIDNLTLIQPILNEVTEEQTQIEKDRQIVIGILSTLVFTLMVIVLVHRIAKMRKQKRLSLLAGVSLESAINNDNNFGTMLGSVMNEALDRRSEGHLGALNSISGYSIGSVGRNKPQKTKEPISIAEKRKSKEKKEFMEEIHNFNVVNYNNTGQDTDMSKIITRKNIDEPSTSKIIEEEEKIENIDDYNYEEDLNSFFEEKNSVEENEIIDENTTDIKEKKIIYNGGEKTFIPKKQISEKTDKSYKIVKKEAEKEKKQIASSEIIIDVSKKEKKLMSEDLFAKNKSIYEEALLKLSDNFTSAISNMTPTILDMTGNPGYNSSVNKKTTVYIANEAKQQKTIDNLKEKIDSAISIEKKKTAVIRSNNEEINYLKNSVVEEKIKEEIPRKSRLETTFTDTKADEEVFETSLKDRVLKPKDNENVNKKPIESRIFREFSRINPNIAEPKKDVTLEKKSRIVQEEEKDKSILEKVKKTDSIEHISDSLIAKVDSKDISTAKEKSEDILKDLGHNIFKNSLMEAIEIEEDLNLSLQGEVDFSEETSFQKKQEETENIEPTDVETFNLLDEEN